MEIVAWLAGEPHGDRPRCTSEIIAAYVRGLNDLMPDVERQRLIPFLPRLVDTADAALEDTRSEFFAFQAARVFAPAALRAQGYRRFAAILERAETLERAQRATSVLLRAVEARDDVDSPAYMALVYAQCAVSAALWFASSKHLPFGGASPMTPVTACADAAASAVYEAWRAGVTEAWRLALETLDEALVLAQEATARASYRFWRR